MLAKHGYTTRWGFFSGTCPGSDHQPYELSCDLLPHRLEWTRNSIAALTPRIESLRQPATSTSVPNWVTKDYRTGRTLSVTAEIRRNDSGHLTIFLGEGLGYLNPYQRFYASMSEVKSELDLASLLRKVQANLLANEQKQLQEYARWLEVRIAEWKIRPLTPVKADPPKDPAKPPRRRAPWSRRPDMTPSREAQ
jgi:hypothetical protein